MSNVPLSTTVEILSTSKGERQVLVYSESTTVEILSTSKGVEGRKNETNLQQ